MIISNQYDLVDNQPSTVKKSEHMNGESALHRKGRQRVIQPGATLMMCKELYALEKPSMKPFQPFWCKTYLHIPESVRRKNHTGRAELGIFVGFDEQTYPGYKFYRPRYRDYAISAYGRFFK